MSLISTRNFIEPLTNKVNLVSIVLCTIAFAILRLSGCAFETVDTTSKRLSIPVKAKKTIKTPTLNTERSSTQKLLPTKKLNTKAPARPTAKKKDRGSLADIEKTLGLR